MAEHRPFPGAWRGAVLALAAWGATRALQVSLGGWGFGSDVDRYQWFARLWGGGAAPYGSFHPEYPPGSLPIFIGPLLVGGEAGYLRSFALEMAAFDAAALLLVLAWARRLHPGAQAPQAAAVGGYLLATAPLYPVLYARFDLVPAVLTLAALYLAYGPFPWAGALLLGLAGATKLWPLALVPVWLGLCHRRGGWRAAARGAAWIAAGIALPVLPFLPRAGAGVAGFLGFHSARGIQLESTWATLAMLLHDAGVSPVRVDTGFGAIHLRSGAATLFAAASTPALLLLAVAPQLAAFLGSLGREADARGEVGLTAACGAVLGFLLGGKVLSPQFMVWIAPLLPLVGGGALALAGAVAAAVLTTAIYPYLWRALLHEAPGHPWALAALAARNLILVGFYALMLRRVLRLGGRGGADPPRPARGGTPPPSPQSSST